MSDILGCGNLYSCNRDPQKSKGKLWRKEEKDTTIYEYIPEIKEQICFDYIHQRYGSNM